MVSFELKVKRFSSKITWSCIYQTTNKWLFLFNNNYSATELYTCLASPLSYTRVQVHTCPSCENHRPGLCHVSLLTIPISGPSSCPVFRSPVSYYLPNVVPQRKRQGKDFCNCTFSCSFPWEKWYFYPLEEVIFLPLTFWCIILWPIYFAKC